MPKTGMASLDSSLIVGIREMGRSSSFTTLLTDICWALYNMLQLCPSKMSTMHDPFPQETYSPRQHTDK